eukprot:9489652-Pyramimonas_sp.AAC.1
MCVGRSGKLLLVDGHVVVVGLCTRRRLHIRRVLLKLGLQVVGQSVEDLVPGHALLGHGRSEVLRRALEGGVAMRNPHVIALVADNNSRTVPLEIPHFLGLVETTPVEDLVADAEIEARWPR